MPTLKDMRNIGANRSAGALPAASGGSSPVGAPQYADIFNYLDPNTEGAKATWAKTTTDPGSFHYETDKDGNTVQVLNQTLAPDQSQIPEQYRGLVAGGSYMPGSGMAVNYDYSKLPGGGATVFGNDKNSTINQMYSLGSGAQPTMFQDAPQGGRPSDALYAKDPSKVKYDPQFGWITPTSNMTHPEEKEGGVFGAMDKYGMPIALGAASMFGGPEIALATGLFGSAKTYGDTGDLKKALLAAAPSLIGAGVGMTGGLGNWGIPPEVMNALKYAKGGYSLLNAARNRNPVSGGLTLAQMAGYGG